MVQRVALPVRDDDALLVRDALAVVDHLALAVDAGLVHLRIDLLPGGDGGVARGDVVGQELGVRLRVAVVAAVGLGLRQDLQDAGHDALSSAISGTACRPGMEWSTWGPPPSAWMRLRARLMPSARSAR